jgi:hypothetical protein
MLMPLGVGISMQKSASGITRIDGSMPAVLVPLQLSIDMCDSGYRFVQTCEHRLHRSKRDFGITHPPIRAAIPKFTERVIVQLPMSQIQPVIVEKK